MIAPVCCMAQTYNRDSLEALVAQNIKEDSTAVFDDYMRQLFPVTDSLIKDEGIRERLKADLMLNLIDMTCAENIQPYIDKYLVCSHTDSLQAKVKARFAKFMDEYGAIQPGRMAPDISFTNLNGKTMHLSDLRGKVVLVDVWGTWCAPCREEMPYIEKPATALCKRSERTHHEHSLRQESGYMEELPYCPQDIVASVSRHA